MGNKSALNKTFCICTCCTVVSGLSCFWLCKWVEGTFLHACICVCKLWLQPVRGARREGCAEHRRNPKQGSGGAALLHFSAGRNSLQIKEWKKPSRGIPLQSCLGSKPQMSLFSFPWGEGPKSLCSPADALFQLPVGSCLPPPLTQILPHSPPGESLWCRSSYKQIFLWPAWWLRQTWPPVPSQRERGWEMVEYSA